MKYQALIAFGCILIIGCSPTEDRYAPVFQIFNETEVVHISIEERDVIDLYPEMYEVLRFDTDENYFGGYGHHIVALNNDLFVANNDKKSITKYNLNTFEVIDKYSFVGPITGPGPGEYNSIDYLFSDGNYIFVLDRGSFRLIQYDYKMNHLSDYKLDDLNHIGRNGIAINDNSVLYPIGNDEEYLLKSKPLEGERIKKKKFHRRIISLGKQPRGYNNVWIKSNNNESIAVVSVRMPVVFIYDRNLQSKTIIRLIGKHIDLLDRSPERNISRYDSPVILNPSPIDIDTEKIVRLDGFGFVDAVYYKNQLYLYFSNRYSNERYLILLENKLDEWIHAGSYRFLKKDQDLFAVFYMGFEYPWLYLGSAFEENVIRININQIASY